MHKGIFVDDQEDVWADTLSTKEILEFSFQEVAEVVLLSHNIIGQNPIIVAVDYRLDEVSKNVQADQTFKGSALAQHLRDSSIEQPSRDFALVLISAEGKIRKLYQPDETAHDLFDRVYVKEEVNKNREATRAELVSLCAGYEKLRADIGNYDLISLTGGSEDDRPFVDIQELRAKLHDAAAPHVASRILLSLIDTPGPLLGVQDACAFLGINPGDVCTITAILKEQGISYTGIFSEGWPRFWANRLEKWALQYFKRRATGLPASDRAKILSEVTKQQFEPALSPWNHSPSELIAFACVCCGRGAELRHSVAAFEPGQPRYAMTRRICWDCIQTDKYQTMGSRFSVDDADRDIVEQVKRRDRNENPAG